MVYFLGDIAIADVLLENAIRGMVGDLDAHSQYLDADEYRELQKAMDKLAMKQKFAADGIDGLLFGITATPWGEDPRRNHGSQHHGSGDDLRCSAPSRWTRSSSA